MKEYIKKLLAGMSNEKILEFISSIDRRTFEAETDEEAVLLKDALSAARELIEQTPRVGGTFNALKHKTIPGIYGLVSLENQRVFHSAHPWPIVTSNTMEEAKKWYRSSNIEKALNDYELVKITWQ